MPIWGNLDVISCALVGGDFDGPGDDDGLENILVLLV